MRKGHNALVFWRRQLQRDVPGLLRRLRAGDITEREALTGLMEMIAPASARLPEFSSPPKGAAPEEGG